MTAKIILSSILLKKEDRLSKQVITKVNQKLQELCNADQQLHFMDNTPNFTSRNRVDTTMHTDETSLSRKGTASLAKNIMTAINTCLKTGYNTRDSSRNVQHARSRQAGNFHETSLQKTMGQHHGPRTGPPRKTAPGQHHHLRGPRPEPPRLSPVQHQQSWGQRQPEQPTMLPPWLMPQYWGPPPHIY